MADDAHIRVLGQIPSGLFILTARHMGQETGLLVSWVMQAGFEPPTVSVALRTGRLACAWLDAGVPFVLNLLPTDDKAHLKHFGRGFGPEENAFAGLEIDRTAGGVPVLRDTVGHLECRPLGSVDSGDHRLFVAEIVGGGSGGDGKTPLVHIRRNGSKY
jgi:flavin reductase (DIM6/NTAB) family NADH-FMN oxidoreductase RutF